MDFYQIVQILIRILRIIVFFIRKILPIPTSMMVELLFWRLGLRLFVGKRIILNWLLVMQEMGLWIRVFLLKVEVLVVKK